MAPLRPPHVSSLKSLLPKSTPASRAKFEDIFKPYTPHVYKLLPDKTTAQKLFESRSGDAVLRDEVHPLLDKYDQGRKLAVDLCYQHMSLRSEERLVEQDGQMTIQQCRDCFLGRKLEPIAWCLHAGQYMPYEFQFMKDKVLVDEKVDCEKLTDFFGEVSYILHRHELDWVVGIRAAIKTESDGQDSDQAAGEIDC